MLRRTHRPTQFLTAAHCTAFLINNTFAHLNGVTFDPTLDPNTSTVIPAASVTVDPLFGKDFGDRHDLAVITLASPAPAARFVDGGAAGSTCCPGGPRSFRKAGLDGENVVSVSPDLGRVKAARRFAQMLEADFAIMTKVRPAHELAIVSEVIGNVKGKIALLGDDMIVTGARSSPRRKPCWRPAYVRCVRSRRTRSSRPQRSRR